MSEQDAGAIKICGYYVRSGCEALIACQECMCCADHCKCKQQDAVAQCPRECPMKAEVRQFISSMVDQTCWSNLTGLDEALSSPCPLEAENDRLAIEVESERAQKESWRENYKILEAERDSAIRTIEQEQEIAVGLQKSNDRLRAALKGAVEALEPFKRFHEAIKAKPIRGLDPEDIYAIHGGDHVEGGTSLKWSDCERAATALSAAKEHLK